MFRPSSESNKGNCQLGVLLHSMGLLLTPSGLEKCSSIEMELKYSLEQVAETCDGVFDAKFKTDFNNGNVSWNFVCLSLNILSQLKKTLKANSEEMLSISQKKTVRLCLEKVICLELLPNLLPGVGLGPSAHTLYAHVVPQHKLSDMEKYERICHITDALLDLNEEVQFHDLLVLYFLGDILSALCQLALVPYKKPQDSSSDNAVSREMYDSLMLNKVKYNDMLSQLTSKTYQPMVIKELMIIQGNKKSPTWIKRGVSQLLNKRLIQQGGVLATVRAITDASNTDTPAHSTQIGVIAKLIATPHCKEITKEDFYRLVCPQILEMLDSKEPELIHIAIECCQTLTSAAFEQHILRPTTKPLREFPGLEPDITRCLHRLHKSFIIPVSDLSNSSVHLLLPYVQLLFRMYCRIYQSVSHLRTFVEDLLWCILSKNNEEKLNNVFNSLIFDVKCSAIKPFPDGIEVVFGDEGGLQMVREKNEHSLEEFGDALMVLLDRRDNEGNVGNSLFTLLLKLSTNEEHKNSIQKYLVTVKLLAVLSENSKVQQAIAKNPKQIILFIKSFIEIKLNSCDEEIEIICLALMVLTVVLNDTLHSKKPDWTQFQDLIAPLTAVRNKTSNIELRMLADEACNMIITDGGAKKTNLTENKKQEKNEFIEESDCSCEEALTDACDPLLPVRGHAMMKLAKLIRAGDKQTIVKKETILCIFQENLKHEDSFLYLTAIEGLSTLASEFPDTIMMTLIDEYSRTDRTQPDVRLKVGEALVRVIRLLGELVPTYKTELLNVFLAGTRDEDALVRTSSLVNLGDVCSLLGYRIGTISAEILQCVRSIVQTDKAVEPRRAAVMLVTILLKGLEKDALFVLQDILKELYSTLKFVYNTDKDDVTKLHAQLALEELNSITRAFLFPPQQLSRRIYVLDAPP